MKLMSSGSNVFPTQYSCIHLAFNSCNRCLMVLIIHNLYLLNASENKKRHSCRQFSGTVSHIVHIVCTYKYEGIDNHPFQSFSGHKEVLSAIQAFSPNLGLRVLANKVSGFKTSIKFYAKLRTECKLNNISFVHV